jgi:hypothetical protein
MHAGRRVELGEIEHQLRRCISFEVDVAAELVRIDQGRAAPTIAAFVRCDKLSEVLEAVVAGLEHALPHHMIPTLFIPVERIPLSAGGKIDRRALREIAAALSPEDAAAFSRVTQRDKRRPETANEWALADSWCSLLHLSADSISLVDNFFRVGGDRYGCVPLFLFAFDQRASLTQKL